MRIHNLFPLKKMSVKIISVYNLDIMTTPEYPDWTPSEVVQNLQNLGLGKYGTAFLDNDVNGEALIYLKDSHLKELGVKLIGHRLTLINFINNLKSNKSIQPNRPSLRSTSSSHNDEISQKSTKPQYQDEENSTWAQRRQQQKQAQFRQQQQQMQQQQDDDDGHSHRSIRKSQADDHNSYRVAKKVSNDDENNYFQSRNQRRNYQDNSDSDTNMPKQNDWEQKRKQVQMRQQYQQQQQQESQQPTRTLSNERFQTNRTNNFNDTSSSRKTPDQYSRRNQNSNYNNHYEDNDNFDEEENPFVSRPKIRDNPMSSPAVKTSAYSNNYHNNNAGVDDDYDKDDEKEEPYSRPSQRNQQRDDYYSSRHTAQQQQRKTPSRQGAGSNPASSNRYSAAQQDYQDDHVQSIRRQPYRQQVQQQQYEDMDEDDEQGQDEEDDDQGYQDDYPKYQPPQRQPPMNTRQQSQPQISNQPQERVECKYCGRKFAIDRIDKHEQICAKTSQKKKKPFDARKMRIKGSEAEQFIHKMDDDNPPPNKSKNGVPKYKLEHEKLISNLRAARQFTEYENNKASGKPVGPPPALPSYPEEDDDREPCPYCGRKFAPEAAKRHIPVCQRMSGNKSKMLAGNRRAGKR